MAAQEIGDNALAPLRPRLNDLIFLTVSRHVALPLTVSQMTIESPTAMSVREALPSRLARGSLLEGFALGAASMANLLELVSDFPATLLAELIDKALVKIDETEILPAITEDFAAQYGALAAQVLAGEEPTTRASLLGFLAGFWWLAGLTDLDTAKVRRGLFKASLLGAVVKYLEDLVNFGTAYRA